jgi:hypothetical protein
LTWLRYAYIDGQAVYSHNAGVLKYGTRVGDPNIRHRIWAENYQELINLQLRMKRYLKEGGRFDHFDDRSRHLLENTVQELMASI